MKGYDDITIFNCNVNLYRRKWDGQWILKINNMSIKIKEETYNKLIKTFKKLRDDTNGRGGEQ